MNNRIQIALYHCLRGTQQEYVRLKTAALHDKIHFGLQLIVVTWVNRKRRFLIRQQIKNDIGETTVFSVDE